MTFIRLHTLLVPRSTFAVCKKWAQKTCFNEYRAPLSDCPPRRVGPLTLVRKITRGLNFSVHYPIFICVQSVVLQEFVRHILVLYRKTFLNLRSSTCSTCMILAYQFAWSKRDCVWHGDCHLLLKRVWSPPSYSSPAEFNLHSINFDIAST